MFDKYKRMLRRWVKIIGFIAGAIMVATIPFKADLDMWLLIYVCACCIAAAVQAYKEG